MTTDDPIDRASTLSVPEVDLLERMFDESSGKFHGDVRLSRADLRRAKRLLDLKMVEQGRLSDKHYALMDKGKDFVKGLRKRRDQVDP